MSLRAAFGLALAAIALSACSASTAGSGEISGSSEHIPSQSTAASIGKRKLTTRRVALHLHSHTERER